MPPPPTDGPGAGDVPAVAMQLCPCVHQHHFSVFYLRKNGRTFVLIIYILLLRDFSRFDIMLLHLLHFHHLPIKHLRKNVFKYLMPKKCYMCLIIERFFKF